MSAAYKIVMIRHGESEWNKVSFLAFINYDNLTVPQFFGAALVSVRIFGYTGTDPVLAITLKFESLILRSFFSLNFTFLFFRFQYFLSYKITKIYVIR
jgi:hypothetical protein